MRSIVPIDASLIDQPQIDLVNKGRRLERVVGAFAPELSRRDSPELRVDLWQQLIERVAVAAPPRSQ